MEKSRRVRLGFDSEVQCPPHPRTPESYGLGLPTVVATASRSQNRANSADQLGLGRRLSLELLVHWRLECPSDQVLGQPGGLGGVGGCVANRSSCFFGQLLARHDLVDQTDAGGFFGL